MNNKALRVLTLLALITLSTTLMAQKQFTLEDLNFGGTNYKNMTPGDRTLLWWGDRLVHVEASACYTVRQPAATRPQRCKAQCRFPTPTSRWPW